jgi:hypothetical protein
MPETLVASAPPALSSKLAWFSDSYCLERIQGAKTRGSGS